MTYVPGYDHDVFVSYAHLDNQGEPAWVTNLVRHLETEVKQRMLADVTPEYSFSVVDRALPADKDDPLGPTRLALLIAGPFVGFAIGTIGAVVSSRQRSESARTRAQTRG